MANDGVRSEVPSQTDPPTVMIVSRSHKAVFVLDDQCRKTMTCLAIVLSRSKEVPAVKTF